MYISFIQRLWLEDEDNHIEVDTLKIDNSNALRRITFLNHESNNYKPQ